nr:hypothetical protein CISIN_1g024064mg [Ipomoea batatas]
MMAIFCKAYHALSVGVLDKIPLFIWLCIGLFILVGFSVELISRIVLYWTALGDTKFLAAVYGPKARTKKNENGADW